MRLLGAVVRDVAGEICRQVRVEVAETRLEDGALLLSPALWNEGHYPVRLAEVAMRLAVPIEGQVFVNGWCSASPASFVPASSRGSKTFFRFPPPGLLPGPVRWMFLQEGASFPRARGRFESEWVTAIYAQKGPTLVIGAAGLEHHFTTIRVDSDKGEVEVAARLSGAEVEGGGSRPLEPVVCLEREDPFGALRAWARLVAARGFARPARTLRLWCSWYSGPHDRIDEGFIKQNLAALKGYEKTLPCFQVDDGWQVAIGDWRETNGRFPKGLSALAQAIADAGFVPGLWLAPFSVSPHSMAAIETRVVKAKDGRPVKAGFVMGSRGPRLYYALDTTDQANLAWLKSLFEDLWAMGFRVFKLDFLTAASVPGIRADGAATSCEAYRRGLRAIREALPPEAVLLGGIAPVFGGAGILDCQRIGPDTFYGRPRWRTLLQRVNRDRFTPGIENSLRAALNRCFVDGLLFSADTDAAVAWGVTPGISRLTEIVTLLAGSTSGVGHDFGQGPLDLSLFDRVASLGRRDIRVLEVGPFPRQVLLLCESGRGLYGVLNPDPRPAQVPCRLDGQWAATDLFSGESLDLGPKTIIPVPARDGRLFEIAAQRGPKL